MFSILMFLGLAEAISQPVIGRRPTISVGFQLTDPRGDFENQIGTLPHGINASFSKPFLGLPIEYGAGFAWNSIASESRDIVIPDQFGNEMPSHLKLNGNAYTYYVHGRFRPFNGNIRPYGEVIAGFKNYSVKSKLYAVDEYGSTYGDPLTDVSDRNYSWITGWAAGIQVRLVSGLFLEGRFEKLNGEETRYIDPSSIQISRDGSYTYEMTESDTDQFTYSIGLAFSF